MMERWLEEAVRACRLARPSRFPRPLASEVILALPVSVVPLAGLTKGAVQGWLTRHGIHEEVSDPHHRMHGCMVAGRGRGFLFCDSEDSAHQQRFTLAHEVGHFVLEHLLPRNRALRFFGEPIRPVLDGECRPTPEQALSAEFRRVPLGIQVRLMDRSPSGAICSGKVEAAELRADRVAFELLAPAALALRVVRGALAREAAARLTQQFGLPEEEARKYAELLLRRQRAPRDAFVESLANLES